jgi:hypothetical protein
VLATHLCVEIIQQVRRRRRMRHVMAYRQEELVAEIIEAAGLPEAHTGHFTRRNRGDCHLMDTILTSPTKEVRIGPDHPFVIIGERINPTGRSKLAAEMAAGNFDRVRADALAQVQAGAQVLDVNAGIPMADEPGILARPFAWCRR